MEQKNKKDNYNFIVNPSTGKKIKLNSKQGVKIMNKYLQNMMGGWGAPSIFDLFQFGGNWW